LRGLAFLFCFGCGKSLLLGFLTLALSFRFGGGLGLAFLFCLGCRDPLLLGFLTLDPRSLIEGTGEDHNPLLVNSLKSFLDVLSIDGIKFVIIQSMPRIKLEIYGRYWLEMTSKLDYAFDSFASI
jgi:hypothetical protein